MRLNTDGQVESDYYYSDELLGRLKEVSHLVTHRDEDSVTIAVPAAPAAPAADTTTTELETKDDE